MSSGSDLGLDKLGINFDGTIHRNLSYDDIAEHESKIDEGSEFANGRWATNGVFAIDTGKFTGRSPKDKYFVDQAPSTDHIWWGSVNKPMAPAVFDKLQDRVTNHYSSLDNIYVFDGFCGASEASRLRVRFLTELPWQHHFVTNMFIRPDPQDLEDFEPDFTIINGCKLTNPDWQEQGLNSENFVAFNMEENVAVIGGTRYGGEMKKGIFSVMNMNLPLNGVMAMHCSANKGPAGDTALFFGLSGTGKTTLSADPNRFLIGDDEHGWDDHGIFNFEGGCYAKTTALSAEAEPEIHAAASRRDALLENVTFGGDGNPDFFDTSKTENGRVSYPIYHIPNYEPSGKGTHPTNCIFLTCDAYGVLPPVSRLSEKQAMYHFLSGYTAKVAGTERGVTEPEATFSACFGAAFLPLHPTKYAELLEQKLLNHGTKTYLINTGWSGGGYGVGSRMPIAVTRACVDAVLDGSIESAQFRQHPVFGFEVPTELPGVDSAVLSARNTWPDKDQYDATADRLAQLFKDNYQQFLTPGVPDYSPYGPK